MIDELIDMLRPDVLYLAVSQDDQGLFEKMMRMRPNVLVLSAGGYGHGEKVTYFYHSQINQQTSKKVMLSNLFMHFAGAVVFAANIISRSFRCL